MTKAFCYFNLPLIKNQLSLSASAQYSSDELIPSPTLNIFKKKIFPSIVHEETEESEIFEESSDPYLSFYDVQAKVNYQPNAKWLFNASFFTAYDKFEYYSFNNTKGLNIEEEFETRSTAMQATAKYRPDTNSQITAYGNFSSYDYLDAFELNEDEIEEASDKEGTLNKVETLEFGLQYELNHHKNWLSDISLSSENKDMFFHIEETSFFETEDINEEQMHSALFIHMDINTTFSNNRWLLNLGLRNSYLTTIDELFISPRGNIQYKLMDALKLKASAGFHYQFISQLAKVEDGNFNNSPIWYINANDRSEVLNAQKFSFGAIFQQNNWLFDVEAYQQKTKKLPAISTMINSEDAIDYLGEGFSRGIDFLALKKWKTLTIWTNYTLSKNEYTFTEVSTDSFPAPNDHRHNLSINSSYKFGNWQCAFNYYFRTALPYSSKPTITYELEDGEFDDVEIKYKSINNLRIEKLYNRLDASLSYKGTLFKDVLKFNTRLSVINLLNKENAESINYHLAYDEKNNKLSTEQIKKLLLPVTPQLTFHLSW